MNKRSSMNFSVCLYSQIMLKGQEPLLLLSHAMAMYVNIKSVAPTMWMFFLWPAVISLALINTEHDHFPYLSEL